jgi:hypothetical protein
MILNEEMVEMKNYTGGTVKMENDLYCVEIDSQTGVISRILDKIGQVDLLIEQRLADNFRLLLPLPQLEANYILGKKQALTSAEQIGNGMTLRWDGPLKNPCGDFDLDVAMKIEFVDSTIEFRMEVNNQTQCKLAEVWYPLLGGLTGIGERKDTQLMIPSGGASSAPRIFENFPESMGIGGGVPGVPPFPEFNNTYPGSMCMPWVDIYNAKLNRGIYFANHDTVARFKSLRFEMQPAVAHQRPTGNWPRPEELRGRPMGVTVNWVSFPYIGPGETFEGPPVVVQFHEGDWHQAAMIYRKWFTSKFTITDPHKSWMRQETAFQDTMFLLPEGNVLMRFQDISQWAKDALDYGVKSVLISGWNLGGHDSSYPHYDPDPRLGTWDELAEGISECHKMEIKVFFFVNLQPVDVDTDWYREELYKYRAMDSRGSPYGSYGWGMGTLGARLGYTRRPLASASPGIPEFRDIIVQKVRKLSEIGADGVHIDKLLPVGLDFNPKLKTSPDRASWQGTLQCLDEILEACRPTNPEFCISVESAWDRTLQYTDAAWTWHGSIDHVAALKFAFPEWMPNMSVVTPYDYNAVNNAVRYGYQIIIGPTRWTASMQDEPMRPISSYIREIVRIRELEELKDTIFLGEFLDTLQVDVEGAQGLRFNTHRNPRTGKRACVLVNFGLDPLEATLVAFGGNDKGTVGIYKPFEEVKGANLPVTVTVRPERFVIVVEE